ncbi:substrate-binding domain-containing protein [Runella sp. CRIBMP]|uniref:LacI family transcriptional regulator n=1 Tax=Runella salmonicolor TaxID=2950278 RepID=A0ABT1FP89_9BACT|nr:MULTISPECIES: LacI family DNA-binding transcriptional regulator [Runella]MCP1383315.1 LacI family transcriptional regulator [Runella salmonicolor]NBB20160.1 substrate-binding domain-containing protein [Runella sp. CRIBMP]
MEIITIKDIAKALNLSTSTVSRALRGSYEINPETKRLVMEYAERMNYRPNPIALSLKENRSRSIGVIIPEIANNFFSQAINGMESIAYNRGYHVVISQNHESYERELVSTQYLAQRRVDGLLVSLSGESNDLEHFKELQTKGLPIVFFDRVPQDYITHKVIADNFAGTYEATEHLIKQGFRRIAHLTSPSWLSITYERLEGYKKALQNHDIPIEDSYIKYCSHGGMIFEEVEQAVMELINHPNRPDAVFTAGDRLTTTCMSLIRREGLRIPEDIAIVGFTNLMTADLLNPALSAVRQPAYEMGQLATEFLIDLIEHPKATIRFETKKLDTHLVIRDSSLKATP